MNRQRDFEEIVKSMNQRDIFRRSRSFLIDGDSLKMLKLGKKMKQKKQKPTKKRSNKYQKKISLYGIDEKEIVKELLKSPPMSKEEEKKS